MWRTGEFGQCLPECIDSVAGRCHNRADGHATKPCLQCVDIDSQSLYVRRIRHGQRNDHWQFQLHQLLHQVQTLIEIRHVDNRQDAGGWIRARHSAEDDIDGDALFQRVRA